MRVPGGSQDLRDLQDTVQSLLLHLARVEDNSVAVLLNIVQVFVGDKMAVVGHLVGLDQVGNTNTAIQTYINPMKS